MDNSEWQIRSLVLRFIESLLKLYPPRFRHKFYSEIQKVILSRLRDAEQIGQWPSAVVQEIAGLVLSIIQERWHELRFRKETIMIIANEKPRWSFYLEWVVLNVITVVLAGFLASALISLIENVVGGTIQVGGQSRITEDFLFLYVLLPIIGLLTGILQYILLRHYLPRMGWWIGATLLGWLLPFGLGFVFTTFLAPDNSVFSIMLGMFLIGATISLPQWWMLHQRVRHAFWWVLTYGVGWWSVGSLSLVTSDWVPVLIAIALIPTIATSIACWLLLDWVPKRELEKRRLGS